MKTKTRRAPATTTAASLKRDKNRRHARVFKYASSKADERFFKSGITTWLLTAVEKRPTWTQQLFNMVHQRNQNGLSLKYCHFNENQQRVFLSRDFEVWANETRAEIYTILKQIHGGQ